MIGGKPCQLEYCYLIQRNFPDITTEKSLASLYRTFETKYSTRIVRAEQILSVVAAET